VKILQMARLIHQVLARQVVAALIKDMGERLGPPIPGKIDGVVGVAAGVVLFHESKIGLVVGMVFPARITG